MEQQLRVLKDGGRPHHGLMLEVAAYLNHFPERYHQSREEIAFDYLVQGAPEMRDRVESLLEEHRAINAASEKVFTLLDKPLLRDDLHDATVEAALTSYLASYRQHIEAEDNDVLPHATKVLTSAQWESVARAAPPGPDPFVRYGHRRHDPNFGAEAESRYRELMERISQLPPPQPVRRPFRKRFLRPDKLPAISGEASREKRAPGGAHNWRLLARHGGLLLALVVAYLQYYFIDVQLQISQLPALVVNVPRILP